MIAVAPASNPFKSASAQFNSRNLEARREAGIGSPCTRPLPLLCLSHRNADEAGPADDHRLCDADRRQKHHGDGGVTCRAARFGCHWRKPRSDSIRVRRELESTLARASCDQRIQVAVASTSISTISTSAAIPSLIVSNSLMNSRIRLISHKPFPVTRLWNCQHEWTTVRLVLQEIERGSSTRASAQSAEKFGRWPYGSERSVDRRHGLLNVETPQFHHRPVFVVGRPRAARQSGQSTVR